jgi:hypothetical protein
VGAAGGVAPIFSVEVRYETVVRRFEAQRQCRRAGLAEERKPIVHWRQQQCRVFQLPASSDFDRIIPDRHAARGIVGRLTQVRGLYVAVVALQLQRAAQLREDEGIEDIHQHVRHRLVVDGFERVRAGHVELGRAGCIRAAGQHDRGDEHVSTQAASPPDPSRFPDSRGRPCETSPDRRRSRATRHGRHDRPRPCRDSRQRFPERSVQSRLHR